MGFLPNLFAFQQCSLIEKKSQKFYYCSFYANIISKEIFEFETKDDFKNK